MPEIGKACHELRIRDENRTWRIVYHVDAEAVVILEIFAKTTQQTPKSVIKTCSARLRPACSARDKRSLSRVVKVFAIVVAAFTLNIAHA